MCPGPRTAPLGSGVCLRVLPHNSLACGLWVHPGRREIPGTCAWAVGLLSLGRMLSNKAIGTTGALTMWPGLGSRAW